MRNSTFARRDASNSRWSFRCRRASYGRSQRTGLSGLVSPDIEARTAAEALPMKGMA